jgi:hypothetical protein
MSSRSNASRSGFRFRPPKRNGRALNPAIYLSFLNARVEPAHELL